MKNKQYVAIQTLIIVLFTSNIALFGLSCTNSDDTETEEEILMDEVNQLPKAMQINERLFSIPSPVQVSLMVKEKDFLFDPAMLNETRNMQKYLLSIEKALAFGVYGTDVGYLNIYEKFNEADAYYQVLRVLAKDLGVSNFLDEETKKSLEKNRTNRDSLLKITSKVFLKTDAFLMEASRNEIAVLILTGGWIEGLYIMTQLPQFADKDNDLVTRVAEQKYPLENIVELLRPYYNKYNADFDKLLEELVELATLYDGIDINYTYQPHQTFPEKKLTIINSKSEVVINDYQIKTIKEKIKLIRNIITKDTEVN